MRTIRLHTPLPYANAPRHSFTYPGYHTYRHTEITETYVMSRTLRNKLADPTNRIPCGGCVVS